MLGIASLVALNVGILMLMTLRWWLFLRLLGADLQFLRAVFYRLAGYSVSYLTPGPQFGGEPVQLVLSQRHTSQTAALSALVLDRIYDLSASVAVLVISVAIAITTGLTIQVFNAAWLIAVLLLPLLYLVALRRNRLPLHWLQSKLPEWGWLQTSVRSETQLVEIQRQHPQVLGQAAGVTVVTWLAQITEYWLMLRLLGAVLNWQQLFTALAAVRIAFLLPMPGALGTLEAGQIWTMEQLGLDPAIGLAAATLIRLRDIGLALIGLGLLWLYWKTPSQADKTPTPLV